MRDEGEGLFFQSAKLCLTYTSAVVKDSKLAKPTTVCPQ